MVLGKTIHLHNSTKDDFLKNKRWLRHEIAHVEQYAELGVLRFIVLYMLETFNKGYENNMFEVNARMKERDYSILANVQIC